MRFVLGHKVSQWQGQDMNSVLWGSVVCTISYCHVLTPLPACLTSASSSLAFLSSLGPFLFPGIMPLLSNSRKTILHF